MDTPVDFAALAREAGVPHNDFGVERLIRLVAEHCAGICDSFEPLGDAGHVKSSEAHAVGRELGIQIRALFEVY